MQMTFRADTFNAATEQRCDNVIDVLNCTCTWMVAALSQYLLLGHSCGCYCVAQRSGVDLSLHEPG